MAENKLSAPKLSRLSNVPLPSIKSILCGQSKNPKINTLIALSDALDCQISDFLSEEPIIHQDITEEAQENMLFLRVIDVVNDIAEKKNLSLDNKHEFRKQCVERIFTYIPDSPKQSVDRVYAEWVFDNEWKNCKHLVK